MRRAALIGLALAMAPATALADRSSDAELHRLLQGRRAGAIHACIQPDLSAQPRIIDGQAIVYRRGPEAYVAHFQGGCPQLRADRTIVTIRQTGQLCANDAVWVRQAGGGSGDGFCTFDGFTPYTR